MFWGKLSCFQIRSKANRETGGCQNLGGFRAGEVGGVTAGETHRASERQARLSAMFEERSDLKWGERRSLNAHKSPNGAITHTW